MGILTRSADLVYTFRFLRLLTTKFTNTTAFKLGIIDAKGNRIKDKKIETTQEKSSYNTFHKLVFNIKKLIAKVPGGSSTLATVAAALFLLKENYGVGERDIQDALKESGIDILDFMSESTQWFVTEDKMLSPGIYRSTNDKVINKNCEELVHRNDKIRVPDDSYPVGDMFGLDVYEALHVNTNQTIYITAGEIIK
jgi:hypothetical protein